MREDRVKTMHDPAAGLAKSVGGVENGARCHVLAEWRSMGDAVAFELVVFDMAGTTVYDGDAVHQCLADALFNVARLRVSRDQVNSVMGIPKPLAIASL